MWSEFCLSSYLVLGHFCGPINEIFFATGGYETAQLINYMRDFVDMHLILRYRFFRLAEDAGSSGDCVETVQRVKAGVVVEVLYFQVVL